MAGVKGYLLGFRKKVVNVAVQGHFPDAANRHQFFRPELGRIKNVKIKGELLIFFQYLNTQFIFGVLSILYGIP